MTVLLVLVAGALLAWLVWRLALAVLRLVLLVSVVVGVTVLLFHVPVPSLLRMAQGVGTVRLPASVTSLAHAAPSARLPSSFTARTPVSHSLPNRSTLTSLAHMARSMPGWAARIRQVLQPFGTWYLHTGARILHIPSVSSRFSSRP